MSRTLKQRKYALRFKDNSRTEQSHLPDTDINIIMKRALRGQHTPYIREDAGSYGDATSIDYHHAHNLVADANSQFEELPSKIRTRFDNDPEKFLEFIHDDANMPEAIELGLIQKPIADPEPIDLPIIKKPPAEPTAAPPSGDASPE